MFNRHYGYDSYIDLGAWLTNHQSGKYANNAGKNCKWNYFVKIIATPENAEAQELEIGKIQIKKTTLLI